MIQSFISLYYLKSNINTIPSTIDNALQNSDSKRQNTESLQVQLKNKDKMDQNNTLTHLTIYDQQMQRVIFLKLRKQSTTVTKMSLKRNQHENN